MAVSNKLLRMLPLVGVSALEMAISFLRMFLLTRLLGGYEFGFASALSASYAVIEQLTDLAIYRFVLSTKPELYGQALSVAHALAILRGLVVAAVLAVLSKPMACTLTGCADWLSFCSLALIPLIRGFEHLEIRVGERSYRYWPILITSATSHAMGLAAMLITALAFRTHVAFIAYMVVQSVAFVVLTRCLSREPYRVRLRSHLTRGALVFSLPLLFNGIGLAIQAQGDRLLVGATVGIEALGLYAVTILIAIVPISALTRIVSPIYFAGLHNAGDDKARFAVRRRLYARSMPILAAVYAVVLAATLASVMPFVFGPRFTIGETSAILVSLIAFFRASRADPMTTLLLYAQSTTRLAISNQAPAVGLLAAAGLAYLHPSIEAVLAGVLIGEVATLTSLVFASRHLLGSALRDYVLVAALMFALVVCALLLPLLPELDRAVSWPKLLSATILIPIALVAKLALAKLFRQGYAARHQAVAA